MKMNMLITFTTCVGSLPGIPGCTPCGDISNRHSARWLLVVRVGVAVLTGVGREAVKDLTPGGSPSQVLKGSVVFTQVLWGAGLHPVTQRVNTDTVIHVSFSHCLCDLRKNTDI